VAQKERKKERKRDRERRKEKERRIRIGSKKHPKQKKAERDNRMKEGRKGYEEEEDRWSREGRVRHGMRGLLAEELLMEAKVSCFLLLLHVSICCLFLFV
jgi:hypothetical protein